MLHMPGHHKEGLKPLIGLWGHTGLGSELIVTEKGFCVWHYLCSSLWIQQIYSKTTSLVPINSLPLLA